MHRALWSSAKPVHQKGLRGVGIANHKPVEPTTEQKTTGIDAGDPVERGSNRISIKWWRHQCV